MKRIVLLLLVVAGLGLLGTAHSAPLFAVDNQGLTVSTLETQADTGAPVQLAGWRRGCRCCWYGYYGLRCKWMRAWRCHRRGGWCTR